MCGKDLGGFWSDGPKGIRTYIPITCNSNHIVGEDHHYFMDNQSGAFVYFLKEPLVEVDSRGCVQELKGRQ